MERIPQSVAKVVVFRAYLASDGKTPAIGKTIAITISKNGALAFSNLAAGATNATEMASGFYKFTLATGDVDTQGPLAWRGAHADIDDAGDCLSVVSANNAGFAGVPDAASGQTGGVAIVGSAMTLSSGERDAVAAALLDLANGVETGKTLRQAMRLMAAALAGKRSNSGTATEQYDAIGAPGTARIVVNADAAGDGTPTLTP